MMESQQVCEQPADNLQGPANRPPLARRPAGAGREFRGRARGRAARFRNVDARLPPTESAQTSDQQNTLDHQNSESNHQVLDGRGLVEHRGTQSHRTGSNAIPSQVVSSDTSSQNFPYQKPVNYRSSDRSHSSRYLNNSSAHEYQQDRTEEHGNLHHTRGGSGGLGNNYRRGRFINNSRGARANSRYNYPGHLNVNPTTSLNTASTANESTQSQQQLATVTRQLAGFRIRNLNQTVASREESRPPVEKADDFECMICCDNILRTNPIWYCNNCYNVFHLRCAVEWCTKSIKSRDEAILEAQLPSIAQANMVGQSRTLLYTLNNQTRSDGYNNERLNSVEWPCPACREVLHVKPDKYKCLCGKVTRPEVNRHLMPHSCGQVCGRQRPSPECPHTCNSICHSGRCAPCSLTSKKSCFCGQLVQETKCTTVKQACDSVCNKELACGMHTCKKMCHDGSCGTCEEVIGVKCHCGSKEKQISCAALIESSSSATEFSCGKVCDQLLDCGKHNCDQICHPPGKCQSCKLLSKNIKSCPCGSNSIKKSILLARISCTEPVPTCDNKCNRVLICGPEKNRHKCQKKCHSGPCPPCKLKTTVHCDCTLSNQTIDCSIMYERIEKDGKVHFKPSNYPFSCQIKCNKPKSCNRHRCQNKCCKYLKSLDISLHKCSQTCGKKLPCGQHTCQETCHQGLCGDCVNIGWNELSCHCGASIMYPPIPCGARAPTCHRPCRRPHICGHPVKHECHDGTSKCAPCTVFVTRSCFCGGESKDSVYCYQQGYSCGRTCKKLLKCSQHNCKRVCHDGECETPDQYGRVLCTQSCTKTRYSCKHTCAQPCHGSMPCPVTDCKKPVELSCECGNKKERVDCFKVVRDADNRNMMSMLNFGRSNQDSIVIDLTKKSRHEIGDNSAGPLKKLDCDDTCAVWKRNKALAEALDIAQPDLKPSNIFGDDPLRLLKEATVQDYKFVAATYNTLVRFVKSSKESDKRFIFMQFPPAEKLRREVIHELAHHFNCTSDSQDDEPFRHVVVRAYKNKSIVPDFNIEQLLPITD